jgi:RimJ/RimL family protein N-acetyltransferase
MILGKNVNLKEIEVSDAEFVLSLRLNPELNRYLSPVENNIDKQREWIKQAKNDTQQFYFIIQNKQEEPVGTIRIHDIEGDRFCWGSWIVKPEARKYASFESLVLLYEHAFFNLGLNKSHLYAQKQNKKAVNFHLRFGATIVKEDEQNIYFIFNKENYNSIRDKYQNIINAK